MKEVYVVVDCCSGEDYSTDDPTVLGVFDRYTDAKQFFDDEVSNWQDTLSENYEDDVYQCETGDTIYIYECTDFDYDEHRIMKLVKTNLIWELK